MNVKELLSSKMFWAGLTTVTASIVGFICKQIDMPTMVGGVMAGLTIIFTKQAIVKSGPTK